MPSALCFLFEKVRWNKPGDGDEYSWLNDKEAPADIVYDLRAKNGELSLWFIDNERSNLARVIAAFMTLKKEYKKQDYILFDWGIIESLGLIVTNEPANTKDEEANKAWHRNLKYLTMGAVCRLAECMYLYGETDRSYEAEIDESLIDGIKSGKINLNELQTELRNKLLPHIS